MFSTFRVQGLFENSVSQFWIALKFKKNNIFFHSKRKETLNSCKSKQDQNSTFKNFLWKN